MKKILITGGAGFIGLHLAKKIQSLGDSQVILADDFSRARQDPDLDELLAHKNVELLKLDLTDRHAFEQLGTDYDSIYHLAAMVGVQKVTDEPEQVLKVNALSTLNLLEFASTLSSLKFFLFSSTSEVYSGTLKCFELEIPTPETVPLTLEDTSSPRLSYAISKIYGEALCHAWRKKNLPTCVVRFHNVYGPRMGFRHVIPELMKKIHDGQSLLLKSPTHTRAFCYVEDAVESMLCLRKCPDAIGSTIHVGNSSEEITMRKLAESIMSVMNKNIPIEDGGEQPGSPKRRCPNIDRLMRLTCFEPKVNIMEGLEKTFLWYKNRLDNPHE